MRLFLALTLSPEMRQSLGAAVEQLRRTRAGVRWVDPAAMHLTVRFLGETEPDLVPRLSSLLHPLCAAIPPFDLGLVGLGAFPSPERPRVVWAGAEEPTGTLALLGERVEDAAVSLGWEREERPFSPHVTLGRVRGGMYLQALGEALRAGADRPFGRCRPDALVLVESVLSPSGSRYREHSRFPFIPPV